MSSSAWLGNLVKKFYDIERNCSSKKAESVLASRNWFRCEPLNLFSFLTATNNWFCMWYYTRTRSTQHVMLTTMLQTFFNTLAELDGCNSNSTFTHSWNSLDQNTALDHFLSPLSKLQKILVSSPRADPCSKQCRVEILWQKSVVRRVTGHFDQPSGVDCRNQSLIGS